MVNSQNWIWDDHEKYLKWYRDYYALHKSQHALSTKKYRLKNKEEIKSHSKKRVRFKDKRVILSGNPRTGICSNCHKSVAKGEIKRTHLHHRQYDEDNPLNHTVELCPRCHRIIHVQLQMVVT